MNSLLVDSKYFHSIQDCFAPSIFIIRYSIFDILKRICRFSLAACISALRH